MNLHGMAPERYIEILERTVHQKSDEITADTLRLAELLDERDRLRALLNRMLTDYSPNVIGGFVYKIHERDLDDIRAALAETKEG